MTKRANHTNEACDERGHQAGSRRSGARSGFRLLATGPAGLPLMNAELVNDSKTPHIMEWLRKMHERPAAARSLALGRTDLVKRYTHLARKGAAHA
jgi:hypothetical protein